ncbi:MAG: NAD/NADP octopine/nopaline dehydrogenase family protein [Candidatus Cryptobacteroides sp.]
MKVCICGTGALGHVIAGWLSSRGKAEVNLLSSKPALWQDPLVIHRPDGEDLKAHICKVSSGPSEVIPEADIILFCYPGFQNRNALLSIKEYIKADAFVGCVFASTGFFFEARQILRADQPLWGFQRVPFIARVEEYGKSAQLLGYKDSLNVAVENVSDNSKRQFADTLSLLFERPVNLLSNFYEASLTNSNPLLHPARLYDLFAEENEGRVYPEQILFYEDWSIRAAQLLIEMDEEFFHILEALPVRPGFIPRILDYYESTDAESLAAKLRSIKAFKGLKAPMLQTHQGWVADYSSRYFTEDFPYGLAYISKVAKEHKIKSPTIDKVLSWGLSKLS